jgi:hypothetical protein
LGDGEDVAASNLAASLLLSWDEDCKDRRNTASDLSIVQLCTIAQLARMDGMPENNLLPPLQWTILIKLATTRFAFATCSAAEVLDQLPVKLVITQ